MIAYPEIRSVTQGGRISYNRGILLVGILACFLFFMRTLEFNGLVTLFEGPFQGSFLFVGNGF